MSVSGKSYREVMQESKEYEFIPADLIYKEQSSAPIVVPDLPKDSINLFDPVQLEYYKSNEIVNEALKVIRQRKLHNAVNCPNAYYISLCDYVHKNRLCIPFINSNNKLTFYQTRTILKSDNDAGIPKYLSKFTGDKGVFGINNISADIDYIFKFEANSMQDLF
jgi:hypothetical protein